MAPRPAGVPGVTILDGRIHWYSRRSGPNDSRSDCLFSQSAGSHDDLMYSVTKRLDFCYGHRLLDHSGECRHPHGHNAVVEIEVRTEQLDARDMVCDFDDIKRIVKGWIDQALDHKMLLRHDDPLVEPLERLGEPMYLLDSNPTAERIARLIFDFAVGQGLSVVRVRVWETPTSCAEYSATEPEG